MKIAIVCDDLIQFGGAEKMLMALLEIWKDAPLYTSVASKEWAEICAKKGVELHTSFMQRIPFAAKANRYLAPFFLHILAFQSFDFSGFDVVLSLSSRLSHHIITGPQTKHICYLQTPGRMFWEPFDYFQNESYGFLKPLKELAHIFLSWPLSVMRIMDYFASKRIDYIISNSTNARKRVKKYFGIDSEVVNPFVDLEKFRAVPHHSDGYFLVITRLVSWKKVDIAIKACEDKGISLKIVGDGPDKERLKNIAGPNTIFMGYVQEEEKLRLLQGCMAVINTQLEDFGIVPLEAMACGKPVIAFGEGGVLETVEPGITGEFFYEQTPEALRETLVKFDPGKYNSANCIAKARQFSKEKFKQKIMKFIIMYTSKTC